VTSVDGRWISYSSELEGDKTSEYWLYDRVKGIDRRVLEHPAWGGGIPTFSPDGKMIAIFANYDSRWPNETGAGLYVFETETLQRLPIALPTSIAIKDAFADVKWSQDGSELLIMIRSMSSEPDKREYFSFQPLTKQMTKISGHYDESIHDDVYSRNGQKINTSPEGLPRSSISLESQRSPSEKWNAYFGKKNADTSYILNVADNKGNIKEAVAGRYSQCMGDTIKITGWIDDQRLMYRDDSGEYSTYRVFDATTGKTADLFSERDAMLQFTW
jgi:dipeptidyl aminopeptidase/acylaminoacyl peptidase